MSEIESNTPDAAPPPAMTSEGVRVLWEGHLPSTIGLAQSLEGYRVRSNGDVLVVAPVVGESRSREWPATYQQSARVTAGLATLLAAKDAELAAVLAGWQDAVTAEVCAHPGLPCSPGEVAIEDVPALLAVLSGRIEHADDYVALAARGSG